jgi:coenzyme F420-0:L-glutamate ligase/coenzyme F420-1:gamma-L-glutamate ligase
MKRIEVLGLQTIGEIKYGDDLPNIILEAVNREAHGIQEKDILVLTSKIISKAMGLTKKKKDIKVSKKALAISKRTGKDPVWVQMIMDEGHDVIAVVPLGGQLREHVLHASECDKTSTDLCENEQCVFVTMSPTGAIHTCDAGIDGSNHPDGYVSFMAPDSDEASEAVREEIKSATGKEVAVILADTEMMPIGTMDFAVGSSGIEPRSKEFGKIDNFNKPKFGGMDLTAHELAAASALVFGQVNAGIPVAIIRGYDYAISETENIANTFRPKGTKKDARRMIKEIVTATANAKGLKERLLLKTAAKFL